MIKVIPLKYYDGGFMTQPFAFGGEDGADKFDANVKYSSGLQNYVIDTGTEVILVDTVFRCREKTVRKLQFLYLFRVR